jgi:uncharacterized damage-inducible protein DinB
MRLDVSIEAAAKKAFATAVDWPGWSRSGKTPELAIEALVAYADRYASVARLAGETSPTGDGLDVDVVERSGGGGGTEFGVPSLVTKQDERPVTAAQADRLARLLEAAWRTFDETAAAAPEELRKGPRGGGRNTSKVVAHVVESDHAYAKEMGEKLKPPDPSDKAAIGAVRTAITSILRQPSDGSPIAGRRWTTRYAAHRIAWHALDHAWEIEDRSDPAPPDVSSVE